MKITSILNELRNADIPAAHKKLLFNNRWSVTVFIRDNNPSEIQLYYAMANEVQNNGSGTRVLKRLHQAYCRARTQREREQLRVSL